ncbi:MAG TPA: response regulator, partial [Arachnia sp.]|nr:response regulator [Arachnia sp.]
MADLRVAIVDDDPVLLAELPTLLEPEGIDVVWTATNAADAGRKLSAGERLPDVLVVDVRMPGISGHEFANTVRALHPGLPIVMYTSVDSGDSMRDALECGASGYLVKHDPPERVSLLLRLAAMGQPVFSEAPGGVNSSKQHRLRGGLRIF